MKLKNRKRTRGAARVLGVLIQGQSALGVSALSLFVRDSVRVSAGVTETP